MVTEPLAVADLFREDGVTPRITTKMLLFKFRSEAL
jgi:hypothetical protein